MVQSTRNPDGTFTGGDHGSAPRPDLNSTNDILRSLYAKIAGLLGFGGTVVAPGGVVGAAGQFVPLSGDAAGRLRLVSDDVLKAAIVESRITNLLLAQRFGAIEDLTQLRDDIFNDLTNDPLFNA